MKNISANHWTNIADEMSWIICQQIPSILPSINGNEVD